MHSVANDPNDVSQLRLAMNLSLATGLVMFGLKMSAYALTGSSAILSDAAESVVHIAAVVFAHYSLRLSFKPADADHPYGHAKISYFSAGFEGAMIALAAVYILYTAVLQCIRGPELERLGLGTGLTAGAVIINGLLGYHLLRVGRRRDSFILQANGRHVLTDCWTSLGAVLGLVLALSTGWAYWDPLLAIILALNILWSGLGLMRRGAGGLMDKTDPAVEARLCAVASEVCARLGISFHQMRHRNLGNAWWVELHLLMSGKTSVETGHAWATEVEDALEAALPGRAFVTTHIEPIEAHDAAHKGTHFPHKA